MKTKQMIEPHKAQVKRTSEAMSARVYRACFHSRPAFLLIDAV